MSLFLYLKIQSFLSAIADFFLDLVEDPKFIFLAGWIFLVVGSILLIWSITSGYIWITLASLAWFIYGVFLIICSRLDHFYYDDEDFECEDEEDP